MGKTYDGGKCQKCQKSITIREKECDSSGIVFHVKCFICSVCRLPLNEQTVFIRGEERKLYCQTHAKLEGGAQPICKVYFSHPMIYRITF